MILLILAYYFEFAIFEQVWQYTLVSILLETFITDVIRTYHKLTFFC